jgi:hypothetical protein
MNAERPNENAPALVTRALPDYHLLRPNVVAIPVRLHGTSGAASDLLNAGDEGRARANLSATARNYLSGLNLASPDDDETVGELIWSHALAICYAPQYLAENDDAVKGDFPRIPLPRARRFCESRRALARESLTFSIPTKMYRASLPITSLMVCAHSARSHAFPGSAVQ